MGRRRSPGLGVFSGEGGSKRISQHVLYRYVRHTLASVDVGSKLASDFCSNILGMKKDFCSNILGAKMLEFL